MLFSYGAILSAGLCLIKRKQCRGIFNSTLFPTLKKSTRFPGKIPAFALERSALRPNAKQ